MRIQLVLLTDKTDIPIDSIEIPDNTLKGTCISVDDVTLYDSSGNVVDRVDEYNTIKSLNPLITLEESGELIFSIEGNITDEVWISR